MIPTAPLLLGWLLATEASAGGPAGEVVEIVEAQSVEEGLRASEPGSVEVIEVDGGAAGRPLSQVLGEAAGVHVTSLGGLGQFAQVTLRGSAADQIAIYLDGVPLLRASGGAVNLADLPLGEVERIEIWRGMAPAGLPGMPAGGVINIVTRRPEGARSGEALLGAGSFTTGEARLLGRTGLGGATLTAFGTWSGSRGDFPFLFDNGTPENLTDDTWVRREHAAFSQAAGHLRLEGDGPLAVDLDGMNTRRQVPGAATAGGSAATLATDRGMAVARGGIDRGAARLEGMVDVGLTRERYTDLDGSLGLGARDLTGWTASAGGRGVVSLLGRENLVATGVVAPRWESYQSIDHLAGGALAPSTRLSAEVAGTADWGPGGLGVWITPQIRGLLLRDTFAGADALGRARASPALGLRWSPAPGAWLRASASSGVRAPSFYELFGDRGALVGNPALQPETVTSAEVGASAGWELGPAALYLELTGFGRRAEDLIQLTQNSQMTSKAVNVSRAVMAGAEGRLSLRGEHLGLSGNYTFLHTEDRSDIPYYAGRALPRRPRHDAFAEASLTPIEPLRFSLGFGYTAGTYRDRANLVPLPPRALLGAGARLTTWSGRLTIDLRGENLLGNQVADYEGFPLPGRSVFVTVSLRGPAPG